MIIENLLLYKYKNLMIIVISAKKIQKQDKF